MFIVILTFVFYIILNMKIVEMFNVGLYHLQVLYTLVRYRNLDVNGYKTQML